MFDELAATSMFPGPRIPVLYARDDGKGCPPAPDSLELDKAAQPDLPARRRTDDAHRWRDGIGPPVR
jgi:hypothetical protein